MIHSSIGSILFDKRLIAVSTGLTVLGVLMLYVLKQDRFPYRVCFSLHCLTSIISKINGKIFSNYIPDNSSTADSLRAASFAQQRGYTAEELIEYNGVKSERILVSLRRKVYEVGKSLYGPGTRYHIFAGKEVSRCVAKSVLDDKEANKYWSDCTEEELETLDEHVALFEKKYPVVGWFIPSDSFYEF